MKKVVISVMVGFSLMTQSSVFAAKQVVAGPESTVYGIAYENGISTRALIAANNIQPPHTLTPGQVLLIPGPREHFVGAGETLQTIAEDYGIKVDVLAQENGIHSPYFVQQGLVLSIPSPDTSSLTEGLMPASPEIVTTALPDLPSVNSTASHAIVPVAASSTQPSPQKSALPSDLAEEIAREKGPTASTSTSKPELMGNLAKRNEGAPIGGALALKDDSEKLPPKQEKKKAEKKEKSAAKEPQKKATKEKELTFAWPAEGTIIGKFAADGKNDGINIQVPEGTDVKAAAAGEVMYAGNELKGFGNLLLIKHKGGYVTAYAHLSEMLATKGDAVKQSQVIAKSGTTGDVKKPQLHFEIRKGKQPIDPLGKLAS